MRIDFTDEIASYYHVMDIFILPTRREGFPIACWKHRRRNARW